MSQTHFICQKHYQRKINSYASVIYNATSISSDVINIINSYIDYRECNYCKSGINRIVRIGCTKQRTLQHFIQNVLIKNNHIELYSKEVYLVSLDIAIQYYTRDHLWQILYDKIVKPSINRDKIITELSGDQITFTYRGLVSNPTIYPTSEYDDPIFDLSEKNNKYDGNYIEGYARKVNSKIEFSGVY